MKINYFSHHVSISDEMKEYFNKKIKRLEKYDEYINKLDVYFEIENYQNKVEVFVDFRKGKTLPFISVSNDMYVAIDDIIDRIERNLNKYKSRIVEHKEVKSLKYVQFLQKEETQVEELEKINLSELYKKPLSIIDGILNLEYKKKREFIVFFTYEETDNDDFLPIIIFKTNKENEYIAFEKILNESDQIKCINIKRKGMYYDITREEIKPIEKLTQEEVIKKVDKVKNRVLFYRDAESGLNSIIFVRKNGKKGIVIIDSFQ